VVHAEAGDLLFLHNSENLWQVFEIILVDRQSHTGLNPGLNRVSNALDGAVKGAVHGSEVVMGLTATINADAHILEPDFLYLLGGLFRYEGSIGRNDGAEPRLNSVGAQVKQVFAYQGLASRKHDNRYTHTPQILKE